MKNTLIILALTLSNLIFSQSWEYETLEDYEMFEELGTLIVDSHASTLTKLIPQINKRDFDEFKEWILRDLPRAFTDYSNKFNWKNQFKIGVDDINFDFVTGDTGRTIAQAHSPLEGDIRIIINIDKWEGLNNYERLYMLLHEFGHEAFGMEHGDNILMYPLIPEELKLDGGLRLLNQKEKIASIKKAVTHAEKTYSNIGRRQTFIKMVTNKINNDSGHRKDEMQEFGRGYNFSGNSTKVPIAFNVLYEALDDFYTFISKNIHDVKTSQDILILDTNKIIGQVNIHTFYHPTQTN